MAFCVHCGAEASIHARYCATCGSSVNAPTPPTVRLTTLANTAPSIASSSPDGTWTEPPRLWNPSWLYLYGFLCGPFAGSIVLRKNWNALKRHEDASTSMMWIVGALLLWWAGLAAFASGGWILSLMFTVAWMIFGVTPQASYVAQQYGETGYTRKSWFQPYFWVVFPAFLIGFMIGCLGALALSAGLSA